MYSVRRSIIHPMGSSRREETDARTKGVYSTPEERHHFPSHPHPYSTHPHSHSDSPPPPPTHQQIAMGLHLSPRRTRSDHDAHTRTTPRRHRSSSPDYKSPRARLLPPPARSSLKKQNARARTGSSDESSRASPFSDSTDNASLPSSVSSTFSRSSLSKWRVTMPRWGTKPPPPKEVQQPVKKAVRFTTVT